MPSFLLLLPKLAPDPFRLVLLLVFVCWKIPYHLVQGRCYLPSIVLKAKNIKNAITVSLIFRLRANGRNNSQRCCANNVRSCCVRVGSGVQTNAATPNNVGRAVPTDPTLLRYASAIMEQKKCWELLAKKFDRFQTLRNNTQQHPTTCNRVCKRTQHVTSNNVGSCWSTMLCLFARSLTQL